MGCMYTNKSDVAIVVMHVGGDKLYGLDVRLLRCQMQSAGVQIFMPVENLIVSESTSLTSDVQ